MWVHGGAWRFGNNRTLRRVDHAQGAMRVLFQRAGWAVASINYRFSHQGLFPLPLHDVTEAVQFFRTNARRFGMDARRIAAAGASAGGHLVMLSTFTEQLRSSGVLSAELARYYSGQASSSYPDVSGQVACVGSFYGVSDIRTIFSDRQLAGHPLAHRDDDGAEWWILGSVHPVPDNAGADARINLARGVLDGANAANVPLFWCTVPLIRVCHVCSRCGCTGICGRTARPPR